MNTKHISIAALGAALVAAMAPATASAEERTCRGTLGATTVDNLRVPQSATCTLNGTRVKGTIKVERAATLKARNVRVVGNVQGENAARVNVTQGSRIGGSVQVKQGYAASVLDSFVTMDILFDTDRGPLEASRNVVGGNIQAFQNTGGVRFARNRVNGNLQCKDNRPAPTGGSNVVQGNKEDQCARL